MPSIAPRLRLILLRLESSPQRPETLAEICRQQRGLFPRREVSALVVPLVIEEVWIRACCPSLRRRVDLVREDGDGNWNLDAPDVEETARWLLTGLPIQTGGGDRGVGQPVKRDVVEDVVARHSFRYSVEDAHDEIVALR